MYDGGKNGAGTYQNIINKIPPHSRYIELFLGSGAILNNKKPALENHGVELNAAVIDRFNYFPFAFIHNADVFTWVKDHWHLFDGNTFVYLDPPYPLSSRRSGRDIYKYELTDEQHADILQLIIAMPAMVAISTYKNDLYARALNDWNLYTFQSQTRKGPATEYLYMNYPEPQTLHEYTYLGEGFTDRQRIKRKIAREVSKLKRLPVLERNAVLEGIKHLIDKSAYTAGPRIDKSGFADPPAA